MNLAIQIFQQYLKPFILPMIILVVAWFVSPYRSAIAVSFVGLWDYGSYLMLVAFAGFGISYNRGRMLLVAFLMMLGLVLFDNIDSPVWMKVAEPKLTQFILAGLIPFNLALIAFYKERGIISYSSAIRLGVIVGPLLFFLAIYFIAPEFTIQCIEAIHFSFLESDPKSPAPHAHLSYLLMLGSGIALLTAAGLQKTNLSFGLFAAFCGYILGLLVTQREELFHINNMAMGFILCISILRDSYNMAYLDDLTGLPQRRAMNEQFMSLGSQYTVAMMDIDHFKKFNDTHGHDIGDEVLKLVASQIGKVRDGGKAYRFGGEEFAVIYPSKVKEQTWRSLEEVRQSIESYQMVLRKPRREPAKTKAGKQKEEASKANRGKTESYDTETVSVTISIGVADITDRYETPDDVLKKADKALYQAKDGGRNQVVVWEEAKKPLRR